jgi:hypothetical protein
VTEIHPDVQAWVTKLSDMTVDQIHELLVDAKVVAVPGNYRRCALATFITKQTSVPVVVQIYLNEVTVTDVSHVGRSVKNPDLTDRPFTFGGKSMEQFACNFDDYAYQDLLPPHWRD